MIEFTWVSWETEPCLIEGVEETLRSLHGRVRMGVVTSSRRQHFEIAHARTGLRKYLDFVLTLEDYRQAKPNPDPYLTAINRYRLQPDQCIVVEDSERGLAAATAAGLDCLIVRTEWSKDGDFSKACCIVDSVADVSEGFCGGPDEVYGRQNQTAKFGKTVSPMLTTMQEQFLDRHEVQFVA